MPRILLVKTSSLGDVVHNLPVASDIARALPRADIDWVVEESFAAIPNLHGGVRRVIPVAVRRWRKSFWRHDARHEVRAFLRALRECRYDAVLDTQGLLKSAFIARLARGTHYGLDWRASREPLALFYDHTLSVAWDVHAADRNRSVAAQALGYTVDGRVDYGIAAPASRFEWLPQRDYVVLLHGSSANSKLWPEVRWMTLGNALARRNLTVVLPWGSEIEHARSQRLAGAVAGAVVPPRLDIAALASLLAPAHASIGVDTGLTHLAGALGIRTVGIYTATHIERHGLYGCARAVNVGGAGACPDVAEVESALERLEL